MSSTIDALTLRRSQAADASALRRLATLDSAPPPPPGDMLIAEHDGRMVAAITLDGRTAFGDPFLPTARIIELLRMWTAGLQVAA